jgi:4-hydroxybenzoate polyprenyltransferase
MATDFQLSHQLFKKTPASWHPYILLARLDRPIGTWLLLLPCWWALVLANGGIDRLDGEDWLHAGLFALGAIVMRAAGCVINDLWDRKLDAAVERTRSRPLAAGTVSIRQALVFLAALLCIGFFILLFFNTMTMRLAMLSLVLVVTYPLMKRFTWWPQLFLGFTFNWGALVGFTAVTESVPAAAWFIYVGGIFWTLAYDTIYAHQDKEDDALIGIKSTARLFAGKSKIWVAAFFTLSLGFFIAAKISAYGGPIFTTHLFILPLAHALWQIKRWDMDAPASCLGMFRANRDFGALVLLAFAF